MRLQTNILALTALLASASLAACSGGGSSPGPSSTSTITPVMSATPTPTPSPSPTIQAATASGTVVDFDSNTGLAGVTVAIASYSSTAAPVAVATTGPSGTFTFTAAPGSYLIEIGSNSATDTRATYHNKVTLAAGSNAITQGVPLPEPDYTQSPAQQSGNFRLAQLSSNEQDCVSGANQGRSANSLVVLVPDEGLTEDARAILQNEIAQNTDTPSGYTANNPGFGFAQVPNGTSSSGFSSCDAWTGPSYSYVNGNPPYPYATNSSEIWYGASFGGPGNYGAQGWLTDPR
jgi:hypothetical protein